MEEEEKEGEIHTHFSPLSSFLVGTSAHHHNQRNQHSSTLCDARLSFFLVTHTFAFVSFFVC